MTLSGTTRDADDIPAIDKSLRADLPKPFAIALLRLQPPIVSPYAFKLDKEGAMVKLTGFAPDEAARQRIGEVAKAQFAPATVENDLKIGEGAPKDFAAAVTGAMPALARLSKGSLTLSDGKASVSGEALYAKAADEIKAALAPAPGSGYSLTPDIAVAAPQPPLDAAACNPQFADLLAKGHVEFETGSAVLSKASTPLLDELVGIAQRCQSATIAVSGHTDTVGAAASNLDLSKRRAQAVVAYFATAGLDTSRITAEGFGEEKPIASNDTPEGRAQNRRIEFSVK